MIYRGGYAGEILEIDLTHRLVSRKRLPEDLARDYIGGRGFTSRLQYELIPPEVDPLGPDNVLIIANGPLTGTMAPASSRFVAGAKSPLTGILGDGNCGGHWGPELKQAGYDMLVIRGRATESVYLWINNDKVEIRDAAHLWGMTTSHTQKVIREELADSSIRVASIGQAGENRVVFAGIVVDNDHLAARTGMGAVMGSKNLKAIAVRGSRGVNLASINNFRETLAELWELLTTDSQSGQALPKYGTTNLFDLHNSLGGLSTRNWQSGYFEQGEKLNGDAVQQYLFNSVGCFSCPCGCDRYCVINEGEFAGTRVGGPEYYTLVSFGSKCGNDNLESVLKANELCNDYGLDIGTTGSMVAFAMECYEKGLLTVRETGGLDLTWGNYHEILELVHLIARREGLGGVLAGGFREAVKYAGPASEHYAIQVKGMDPPTFDPRALKVYNFRYAVASRGADHLRLSAHGAYELETCDPKERPGKLKFWQDVVSIPDMMGLCKLPYAFYSETAAISLRKTLHYAPRLYEAATGIGMDEQRVLEVANRLALTERAVNTRLGITPQDDRLPDRFITEELPSGRAKGQRYDILDELKEGFYNVSGWDKDTGVPTADAMQRAGLDDLAEDLRRRGYEVH